MHRLHGSTIRFPAVLDSITLILLLALGGFTAAADFDHDIQGNLYVVDRAANTLVKFSPTGDSIRAVSGFGEGELQFDEPVAVAARGGNDVYVADYNNHRIQRFNRTLDYISTIYTRDDPDRTRRFGYPRDLAVSRGGDLLIVDGENRRVMKFNVLGNLERVIGDVNAGAGRLVDPVEVEIDGRDNIYVLDRGRIVQFDPFGSYMRSIPTGPGRETSGISIDRDTLLVSDSVSARLYDLATLSPAGFFQLAVAATGVRFFGPSIAALEGRMVTIYSINPFVTPIDSLRSIESDPVPLPR